MNPVVSHYIIADLLASGLRRCLRGEFLNNDVMAKLLGKLTIQAASGKPSVHFVRIDHDASPNAEVARIASIINDHCRPMILRKN